jgi:hypothetical protein
MIFVHGGCSSKESFERYKKWIVDAVPEGWKINQRTHPDQPTFPGLAITLIDNVTCYHEREWLVNHTFVSKDALLTALGLSTQEVEVKLEMISEPVPDIVESREV